MVRASLLADVMPMHGESAMAMMSPGATGSPWPAAAVWFVAMWTVMMVAMMLPSLAPTLWHYRRAFAAMGVSHPGRQTALVGLGYFAVWAAIGVAVFAPSAALAAGMRLPALAPAAPLTVGVVVLVSGAIQLTAWKARQLARCRLAPSSAGATAATAWRCGLRLGVHCSLSCSGPMAILLAVGSMDLRAMAVVTAAITAERLAPAGERIARATGAIAVGAGLLLCFRL
jgi:predicted metal-binding membrane protein